MMNDNMKFANTVLLIDVAFIEDVASDFRRHFSALLGRELPKADLALFLECIALEAGVRSADNSIQVLFIYNSAHKSLNSFHPSSLDKELNNVAFKGNLGEFSLLSFQPSDMVTSDELFMESMKVVLDSAEVKNAIVVPPLQLSNDDISEVLAKVDGKENVVFFGMKPMEFPSSVKWETIGYALMKALGIKADEL